MDQAGFPAGSYLTTAKLGSSGDCVIPLDLEKNVVLLHEFLFGVEEYQVSDTVKNYSEKIREKVEKYRPDMEYPEWLKRENKGCGAALFKR